MLVLFGCNLSQAQYVNGDSIDVLEDFIILTNGDLVRGEIIRISNNKITLKDEKGRRRISTAEVGLVSFQEELSELEKFKLGELDGRRFATNSAGNFAIGALFGVVGAAIVYSTAEQTPTFMLYNGPNKGIVDDASYLRGYAKGSRIASGESALIGSLLNLIPLVLLL